MKCRGKKKRSFNVTLLYFLQLDREEMRFSSLTFEDSGMYQCIAENRHGLIYANAELRVFGESHFVTLKQKMAS